MADQKTGTVLLDAREVRGIAPVSAPTLTRWIKAGTFPQPLKMSGRNFWRADEVNAWIEQQSAARSAA